MRSATHAFAVCLTAIAQPGAAPASRTPEDSRRALQILLLTLIGFAALVAPGGAQSVPPLQWSACPDAGQECATLRVPLDYRAPAGREIDVAISRVKSTAPGARRRHRSPSMRSALRRSKSWRGECGG